LPKLHFLLQLPPEDPIIFAIELTPFQIAFSISATAAPIINISKAVSAATDFFAIIDAPKPNNTGLKAPDVSPLDDISLDAVTFAYPSRPHVKVLDELSMRFESGKITAVVGASGSGKSTIVGLLERWYNLDRESQYRLPESVMKDEKAEKDKKENEKEEADTEQTKSNEELRPVVNLGGSIQVGSHNLEALDLKWWRSQIGLVQQEPFIFNDTIYKNVANGLIGSEWEHADEEIKKKLVEEACKEAFADEYINRLPEVRDTFILMFSLSSDTFTHNTMQGYNTQVGDAGIKLSGGQRQRLAIARSIIKRPKILILDEATSSIDVRGERLVQAALDKASQGRTTITIAHRLSTIMKADKIIVLKKGKVIEQGTHEALLEDINGAYRALVNAQKLTMGDSYVDESDLIENSKSEPLVLTTSSASAGPAAIDDPTTWKRKSFFTSFGRLLYEQAGQWPSYMILLIGCLGAASVTPLQAWLFAKLLTIATPFITQMSSASSLQLSPSVSHQLSSSSSHWALMLFILALGAGLAYFFLGASSNAISVVCAASSLHNQT
jgi:ATP-binding cassette subfamily B (MDR/TAP) protein 1